MGFLGNTLNSIFRPNKFSKKRFKILAIDGGGLKGAFAAGFLEAMQKDLKVDFNEQFNLIIGTSTGSILAAALATNYPLSKTLEMYEEKSDLVFNDNGLLKGLRKSRYSNDDFISEVKKILGERKIHEVDTNLAITSVNISTGRGVVFDKNSNVSISDAVIASCAVPVAFKPYRINDSYYVDGGVWANNPGFVGITKGISEYNKRCEDIDLLSIGTGEEKSAYFCKENFEKGNWGLIKWNTRLVKMALQTNKKSMHLICKDLLDRKSYLRIDFSTYQKIPFDDPTIVGVLKNIGINTYKSKKKKVVKLLGL
jgi:hypothetical protein